jgi:dCMP deaminase
MSKQVILYMPVIHSGYLRFLREHFDADEILVLGSSFKEIFPQLKKDIRALDPDQTVRMAQILIPDKYIRVIEEKDILGTVFADTLVMPDEDIMREIVWNWGLDARHEIIYSSAFLRWDRSRAEAEKTVSDDEVISTDVWHIKLSDLVVEQSELSPDWWRQVGAALWRDETILYAGFNDHRPSYYSAVIDGDPRGNFRGGVKVDLSLAEHAEASIIAQAARDGVSLDGAGIAVTTFPCPSCARLIVTAGIKQVVFQTGYVLLEGDELLRQAGVEIIRVAPN